MRVQSYLASIVFLAGTNCLYGQSANGTTDPQPKSAPAVRAPAPDPVEAKIQDALRERDAIIRNLLERVQQLETRLNVQNASIVRTTIPPKTEALLTPTAPAPALAPVAVAVEREAAAIVNNSTYDEDERRASQSLDQALLVRGGLLLPSGVLEADNTASYFSMSSDHLTVDGFALLPVLVVGDITSERLRRDILIHSLTARLGLPKKFQIDFTVPYGYILNRSVNSTSNETSASQFGLGDISAGISRQLTLERGKVPDLLANFHYKSATGTNSYDLQSAETSLGSGFNTLQASLTAAKTSDPVVFFGDISYTRGIPAHHTVPGNNSDGLPTSSIGYLRPGDSFGFQLGSILALNTETSMTLGWDQRFTQETKLNGNRLPASYLVEGSLRIGTSYMYAPNRMLDLSFGVGLTPDTPNLQLSVGFPIRKPLWKPKVH